MSYRAQVKDAIKAVLMGKTIAGDNIKTGLDRPLTPEDLPVVVIYITAAKRGQQEYGRSLTPRTLTVSIEAALNTASYFTAESDAENFGERVEELLDEDRSLLNQVHDSKWLECYSDVSSLGEKTIANVVLEYEVEIMTGEKEAEDFLVEDDGFDEVPTLVFPRPNPTVPDLFPRVDPPPDTAGCDGETGCNMPAWGGEL